MPKRKPAMTVAEVAKLGPGNHRVGGVPGLVLQVNKSGQGRSYTLRYSDAAERRREVGIGSAWEITLAQARDKALQLRQRLKLDGVDPLEAKAQAKAAAVEQAFAQTTFSQAVTEYLKSRHGTWGNVKHEQQFVNTLSTYAEPVLGSMAVADIAPDHVAAAVAPIWVSKAETARRVRQRVELVVGHADTRAGRHRPNPARLKGALEHLLPKVGRAVEHHAALDWRELPELMAKLKQAGGVGARALRFLVYTAARTGEVRGATAAEIERSVWTIPADRMKAGKAHSVPLSTQALGLISGEFRYGELLFPGQGGKPMSDMSMSMVLKRLDVDCTVHGMRASFKSWAGDNGMDRELVELSLAHALGNQVEQAYNRTNLLDRRRVLMQKWADFLS